MEFFSTTVIQLCGRLDTWTMCLYIIKSEPQCERKIFAQNLLDHMIKIGRTTDILSVAYGVGDPGVLTDIMIVVHPDCSLDNTQVESRFQEFTHSNMERIINYVITYTSTEDSCAILSSIET